MALCKTILEIIPEEQCFLDATNGFSHYGEACPKCGATGKLSDHGDYTRGLVTIIKGIASSCRVRPSRFKCASCNATHALLPDMLVPYSPYTLRFKLLALLAYFERTADVASVCERVGIAVSTLYEWKKTLASHKELLFGVVIAQNKEPAAFIRELLGSRDPSGILRGFFHRHGASFMQGPKQPATRCGLP